MTDHNPKTKPKAKSKTIKLPWLFVSLLLTSTAMVPLAYVASPYVLRWQLIQSLESNTQSKRERSLNYLISHAQKDPRVLAGAIKILRSLKDENNFIQIANALDQAGVWRYPTIPAGPWLRWLKIYGRNQSPETRIAMMQWISELSQLADDPRLVKLTEPWFQNTDPQVRLNALVAITRLALNANTQRAHYIQQVMRATNDHSPSIASEAWHLLGWLKPAIGEIHKLPISTDSSVIASRLWALMQIDLTIGQKEVVNVFQNPSTPKNVRAMATYLLNQCITPQANKLLEQYLAKWLLTKQVVDQDLTERNILWRALLGLKINPQNKKHTLLLESYAHLSLPNLSLPNLSPAVLPTDLSSQDSWALPLQCAAIYRLENAKLNSLTQDANVKNLLSHLAQVERGNKSVPVDAYTPDVLRAMIALQSKTVTAAQIKPLFYSLSSTIRDLACVAANAQLSRDSLSQLIEQLINNYDDHAKISGAILSGLSGLQTALLAKRLALEDQWSVIQIFRLGLWMQGRPVLYQGITIDMAKSAQGMLTRADIPATTVLLAMLTRRPRQALDYLLNPITDELMIDSTTINSSLEVGPAMVSLRSLLVDGRWWHVLKPYLPKNAPPFWLWADLPLQQFQLDRLRDWYLVHRQSVAYKSAATPVIQTEAAKPSMAKPTTVKKVNDAKK